jgi:hypothetical protein
MDEEDVALIALRVVLALIRSVSLSCPLHGFSPADGTGMEREAVISSRSSIYAGSKSLSVPGDLCWCVESLSVEFDDLVSSFVMPLDNAPLSVREDDVLLSCNLENEARLS